MARNYPDRGDDSITIALDPGNPDSKPVITWLHNGYYRSDLLENVQKAYRRKRMFILLRVLLCAVCVVPYPIAVLCFDVGWGSGYVAGWCASYWLGVVLTWLRGKQ